MTVVVPNTGTPGESRPVARRVGPLGLAASRRVPGANGQPVDEDTDPEESDPAWSNGSANLRRAADWDPYRDDAQATGYRNGSTTRGYRYGAAPEPGRYRNGSSAASVDPPTTRQPYRGPGRQTGRLQPPFPGYPANGEGLGRRPAPTGPAQTNGANGRYASPPGVDRPTTWYAGSPAAPGTDGGAHNGASVGRRSISPIHADAPTELIRRVPQSYAPVQRPATSPSRGLERSRAGQLGDVRPDTDERSGRAGKGGRRHQRPGGRPAADFTSGKPGGKVKRGRRRKGAFWKELPMLIGVALVLTVLIQTFLARVYEIPSGSMETTLHGCTGCTNDRVAVDKLSYHFGDPTPGDVVVFAGPENWQDSEFRATRSDNSLIRGLQSVGSLVGLAPPDEKDLIKRIIAVGGQTVACCDTRNRVTVDGKPLDEPYIYYLPEAGPPTQAEFGPVKVPEGELWVMGDSRNNSSDSRVPGHGSIPVDAVIGKARFVVLPFTRARGIPQPNPQLASQSAR